jgi:hypothetical protein
MRCTDHASVAVGEQYRSAVGSRHADRKLRHLRDDGVGTRTVVACPRFLCDDDVR